MNNIITLDKLAELLAQKSGISVEEARQYITGLQQSVAEQMTDNAESVTIPHIGTFSTGNIEEGEILFSADESLAEAVNEPFSFFEPEPLCEEVNEVSDDSLPVTEPEPTAIPEEEQVEIAPEIETVPPAADEQIEVVSVDNETPEEIKQTVTEEDTPVDNIAENATVQVIQGEAEAANDDRQEYTYYEPEPERHSMHPTVAYILGILTGMLLTCVAVYFLYPPLHGDDDEYIYEESELSAIDDMLIIPHTAIDSTQEPAPVESSKETVADTNDKASETTTPAKVSTSTRTDTVSSSYFLASMSRKYYGRMEFWVYIYKENEAKLGHPDRIASGTVVTIPDASKYGIDANSQESIDRARQLAASIYEKYK